MFNLNLRDADTSRVSNDGDYFQAPNGNWVDALKIQSIIFADNSVTCFDANKVRLIAFEVSAVSGITQDDLANFISAVGRHCIDSDCPFLILPNGNFISSAAIDRIRKYRKHGIFLLDVEGNALEFILAPTPSILDRLVWELTQYLETVKENGYYDPYWVPVYMYK